MALVWLLNSLKEKKPATTKNDSTSDTSGSTKVGKIMLPKVDLGLYFDQTNNKEAFLKECEKLAEVLHLYGAAAVKDPRVDENYNDVFLDMMERYFALSDGKRDARPEVYYQVGVTPEKIEKARNFCTRMGSYGPDDKPLSPCPPELDAKWRFFWRIGPVPKESKFPALNMDPVIPPEIPEWKRVMDKWGNFMMDAQFVVAEMAAIGFKLQKDAFSSRMHCGPHLLAPTGSDLSGKYGKNGTVLAGFHYDLNFMTIHGKSRFPGLYLWTREGKKTQVAVPDGCLLIQAGKQLEYLTGGHVQAGFHEVVVTEPTQVVIAKKKAEGKSLWRVSSTLFGHIQSDQLLEPLEHFSTSASRQAYPPILTGDQVETELKAIKLGS
eukprot:CAMPEP_0114427108 /NCGR_PEP_ID=MMETSP0103-20121206/8164_1 /TAXON_ID=37642 ORGANISM="Paraphysomonas imperforata, Strain PA2" /NCGR_SAMPLE_ID=MMETSP0103 /ASSEMBLY_ACC=CAM_ASM_000201 /LENGTH=378 /DNA_ID=CAMNT_0001596131 /DNA_START=64 /DNA_END=1200 /DNA_ORIENTATION=+